MKELVSVVVPCFNYARFLRQCVLSVVAQSYPRWECIIVDDGSTDDTPDVCIELESLDERIRVARQANRGLSASRNCGLRLAEGAYVQFLDADDLLEALKIESQLSYLESHPAVDIAMGETVFFEGLAPTRLRRWRREGGTGVTRMTGDGGSELLAELVRGNVCTVNAALVRRRALERVGYFDESLASHEDWDFWIRGALAGCRFGFTSGAGTRAMVREHGESMSRGRTAMLAGAMAVRQSLRGRLPGLLERQNGERLALLKCRLGVEHIRNGKSAGWALYAEGLREARKRHIALAWLLFLIPGAARAFRLLRRTVSSFLPA